MPQQDSYTDATDLTGAVLTGRNGSGTREFPTTLFTPAAIGAAPASHTQAAATITDFVEAVDDRVGALVQGGVNAVVTYNDAGNTLIVEAKGSASSYSTLNSSRNAEAADNGKVLECDGTDRTLTLVAGLGKGWSAVARRRAGGNVTVAKGASVTFAPADSNVASTTLWDDVTCECVDDNGTVATFLVRRVAA